MSATRISTNARLAGSANRGHTDTPDRIRIVIADDHSIVRRGLRDVLAADRGFEVVAEAGTLDTARHTIAAITQTFSYSI